MDLTTKYLGLTLKNPVLASASPLTENMENKGGIRMPPALRAGMV